MCSLVLGLGWQWCLKVLSYSSLYFLRNAHPTLSSSAASAFCILILPKKQMMLFLKNNIKIKLYPCMTNILGDSAKTSLSQKVQGHLHNLCQLLQPASLHACRSWKIVTHRHTSFLCNHNYPSICPFRDKAVCCKAKTDKPNFMYFRDNLSTIESFNLQRKTMAFWPGRHLLWLNLSTRS